MSNLTRSSKGFSFIELIVSAAILAILASVAMPLVQTTKRREKEHELRIALSDIRHAIDAYKVVSDSHPDSNPPLPGQVRPSGYPVNLIDLSAGVIDPANPTGPKLYFLRRVPRDPFYPDASVAAADTWGKRSFASEPDARHEGADVYDVYSRSSEVGMNGVPLGEW